MVIAKISFIVSVIAIGFLMMFLIRMRKKEIISQKEWISHSEEWGSTIGEIVESPDSSYDEDVLNLFSKDSEEEEK